MPSPTIKVTMSSGAVWTLADNPTVRARLQPWHQARAPRTVIELPYQLYLRMENIESIQYVPG